MIKIVIVDDEPDARAMLRSFLQTYCPDLEIVGEANDVSSAVALIRLSEPDIVLLDIHLKEETGFDILDKFTNPNFRVIFTTAYDQHALKAFSYCALDYLLKPIDPDKLIIAIDKAKTEVIQKQQFQQQINNLMTAHRTKTFDKIALPSSDGISFISVGDILYLRSDVNYTLFFTLDHGKFIVSKSLKDFEEILPEDTFCRVHQSYIVNILFVQKILKEDGGYALLENGEKIPISRRKKEGLLKMLTE